MADTRGAKPGNGADKTIRVAVYTRKSTDENLNGDFTSLDSQAEYCKAFIKTREPEGWQHYPQAYVDPGYSGGNMERPGLRKLVADAKAGKFQVVVCYKYDRLTRNTRDFLALLDVFDKAGVHFVSVTQPIDTTSPVGRLMRSILMEFAQFEREMISERTSDKLSAMAKKGKRTGGHLLLGYDLDRENKKVFVNEDEAKAVRLIFETYIKKRSLCATAHFLESKGIRTKRWTARNGKAKGGRRFDKVRLSYFLHNPFFIGKIRHRRELYPGEHKAILDEETFQKAQEALKQNAVKRNSITRGHHNFLLKGLLRCAGCKTLMTPHYSLSKEGVEFFYYRCSSVNHLDKSACITTRSVPAKALEHFVVDRLRVLGQDAALVEDIVKAAKNDADTDLPPKRREKAKRTAEMGGVESDIRNLTAVLAKEGPSTSRYQIIMEQLEQLGAKRAELRSMLVALENEILDLETRQIDVQVFRDNLANFMRLFDKMDAVEQREMIRLVVMEAVYDKAQSVMRLGLLPFQSFDWPQERYGVNFVDCIKTLRMLDALQTLKTQLNRVSPEQTRYISPFWLLDESEFTVVMVRKGRKRLAFPEEAASVDRTRKPKPAVAPRIQALLAQACNLQDRLNREPGLTRDALAGEAGMAPSRLTHLLNLLNLAPEIRERILALPPSETRGAVTERRLRPIARLKDPASQLLEFERLLASPERFSASRAEVPMGEMEGAPFFSSNQSSL